MPDPPASHHAQSLATIRTGFLASLGVALLALLVLIIWHVGRAILDILGPFVFATAFALLLDPIADRLERRDMSRALAVTVVFLMFLLIIVVIGSLIVPALANQVSELAQNGPQYIQKLQTTANEFLRSHRRIAGMPLPPNVDTLTADLSHRSTELLRNSAGKITAFLIGSVSTLFEAIITLILTFYLLLDIDRFRARLFYLAPREWRGPMRVYARDIGGVFSEYLRGMLIVSALYGVATMILLFGMSLANSEMARYALLVGVAGGLLYAVPYLGPFVTAVITFLVAFAAGGVTFGLIGVGLTLVLNQVFDNVITPRVVGGGVGLHPVASLFALTLGGALFGLWGLLLSVPVAASIQVVLFRLYPKLKTPTPISFLRAQGVPDDEEDTAKVMQGTEAHEEEKARQREERS